MSYKIGKKEFKTKTTAKDYFSYILRNSKEGTVLDGQYLEDVKGLLEHHPDRDEKVGVGIKRIVVENHIDVVNNFKSKTSHFHVYRTDGTDIDFSFHACVNNMGKNSYNFKREDVIKAFRFVIRPQIDKFRFEGFGKKRYLNCEILKVNFSKATCHVDHKEPKTFTSLLNQFIKERGLTLENLEIEAVDNYYSTLKNDTLREEWYTFHQENAELRLIHKTANQTQKRPEKVNL